MAATTADGVEIHPGDVLYHPGRLPGWIERGDADAEYGQLDINKILEVRDDWIFVAADDAGPACWVLTGSTAFRMFASKEKAEAILAEHARRVDAELDRRKKVAESRWWRRVFKWLVPA